MDLPDINVWMALSHQAHPHYPRARRYWSGSVQTGLAFCRVTALGYLRLSTNPAVLGANTLSVEEAWRAYAELLSAPDVSFLTEPDGCEMVMRSLMAPGHVSVGTWNDAYLAAFAISGDLRLISFDKRFRSFEGLSLLEPDE